MEEAKRTAVLIDAENVLPSHAEQIFTKAESLGTIVYKEIFGAASAVGMWVAPILKYLIHTNLSVKTTKGKNTSDIALVIGAMDILMSRNIDCVIIVSSDSDFSTLAVRLRNSGITVIGMGTEASNPLWKMACSEFVVLTQVDTDEKQAYICDDDVQSAEEAEASQEELLEAPMSVKERRDLILKVIRDQIIAGGGKVAAPKLFIALNELPAYQADKLASGIKKAQQYLFAVFGNYIHLDTIDGTAWVSLNGETTGSDVNEANTNNREQTLADHLMTTGYEEDTVARICQIVSESKNLITIYNRLRSEYGNTSGSEIYHRIRELMSC